jgi:hypothetical protein
VLLVVGFIVLTVIGVFFRGEGMALMWPVGGGGMSTQVSRRNFLKLTWVWRAQWRWLKRAPSPTCFLSPRTVEGEFGGIFIAGAVDSFPVGSVTPFTSGRFYLVRESDGGFCGALSQMYTSRLRGAVGAGAGALRLSLSRPPPYERDGELVNAPARARWIASP